MQRLSKLTTKKGIQNWLDWNALSPNRITEKTYASVVVIGDSIVAGLRRYPTVWRNFILQYKTVNLGIGGDRIENVLWRINALTI